MDIWFGSDKKCVFGAVIGRELGSRGQDLLVNCSSQMQLISRLLFTQYGIYMELFLLFWLSRVLGTSTFSGRDECGGVTCACTCPKRRNINVVIQDTCTLSSLVNKCITICTPSIHLVVRLANPLTIPYNWRWRSGLSVYKGILVRRIHI